MDTPRGHIPAGSRAFLAVGVRRQPGLRQWRTYDAVRGTDGPADGNGHTVSGKQILDIVTAELQDCNIVCIGPVVMGDGVGAPNFYAAVCSADRNGFFTICLGCDELHDAVQMRALLHDRLVAMKRVVLAFDSELKLAQTCARLWPGEPTRTVRQTIEAGQ
jgi:hypothetical protein